MNVPNLICVHLKNRSVLRVTGRDTLSYIQTFLTNDIRHLIRTHPKPTYSIYSHVMNSMGRSLVDVFVYKPFDESPDESIRRRLVLAPFHSQQFGSGGKDTDQLLIELPSSLAEPLRKCLFAMKIRKKVDIEHTDLRTWVIYPEQTNEEPAFVSIDSIKEVSSPELIVSQDPRLPFLGHRIITADTSSNITESMKGLMDPSVHPFLREGTEKSYKQLRYSLGVGEGDKDHVHGMSFPLECNADILNGLSFKKGMSAGDWITGRNFRKGTQRRLVPISFREDQKATDFAPGTPVLHIETGEDVGHIVGGSGPHGLALIKTKIIFDGKKRMNSLSLHHPMSMTDIDVSIPFWWPKLPLPGKRRYILSDEQIPDGTNSLPPPDPTDSPKYLPYRGIIRTIDYKNV